MHSNCTIKVFSCLTIPKITGHTHFYADKHDHVSAYILPNDRYLHYVLPLCVMINIV